MNQKNKQKSIVRMLIAGMVATSGGIAYAHDTPRGKAAELALHKVDTLVTLAKIEEPFRTAANHLSLSLGSQDGDAPAGTYFESNVSQVPAQDGSKKTVRLFQDDDGKTLNRNGKVISGGDALNPPVWSVKDPISLMEVALHCVQGEKVENNEACVNHADLPAFNRDFSSATLSQLKDANGAATGARVDVRAEGGKSTLKIRINLDGTLFKDQPIEIVSDLE